LGLEPSRLVLEYLNDHWNFDRLLNKAYPLPIDGDVLESNNGSDLGLDRGALLEKVEQRSDTSLLDDHLLVAIVTRETRELVDGVGGVLRLGYL